MMGMAELQGNKAAGLEAVRKAVAFMVEKNVRPKSLAEVGITVYLQSSHIPATRGRACARVSH